MKIKVKNLLLLGLATIVYGLAQQGGVIHWTHRETKGRHINGWLKHNGKTYQ